MAGSLLCALLYVARLRDFAGQSAEAVFIASLSAEYEAAWFGLWR